MPKPVKYFLRGIALFMLILPFLLFHINRTFHVPQFNSFPEKSAVTRINGYVMWYNVGQIIPAGPVGIGLTGVNTQKWLPELNGRLYDGDILCDWGYCYGEIIVVNETKIAVQFFVQPVLLPLRY